MQLQERLLVMTRCCKTFHLADGAPSDVVVRLTGEKLRRSESLVNRGRETWAIYSCSGRVSRKLFGKAFRFDVPWRSSRLTDLT
jgi:hypothetical protein